MTIRAKSADGVIHEFPDGTSKDVIGKAMKRYAETKKKPAMTASETAADVAASLGTGIVRGTAGLIGMPADIGRGLANLAAGGVDYLMGVDPAKAAENAARAEAIMSGRTMAAPTSAEVMRAHASHRGW